MWIRSDLIEFTSVGGCSGPQFLELIKSIIFPCAVLHIHHLSWRIIPPWFTVFSLQKRDRVLPHHNDMLNVMSWCALNQFDWTPCLPVILHLISWCNAFPSYHWLGCPNTKAVFHQMRNFKLNCQTIGAGEPNYIQ